MAFPLSQIPVSRRVFSCGKRALDRLETGLEAERERIGLWAPVALGLGIGLWFALPGPGAWMLCIAGACATALLATALPEGGRLRAAVAGAALLAGLGCALIWGRALLVGEAPLAYPQMASVEGTVVAVERQPAQQRVRLTVAPQGATGAFLPRRIRVTLAERDFPSPPLPAVGRGAAKSGGAAAGVPFGTGAVVRFRARLMPPQEAAVPGGYDFAREAYFRGIGATGRILPPLTVVRPAPGGGASLRERLSAHVRARLPGAEGAIAATLASGDRGAIAPADAEAMRRSGLAHLLSISGLHVSALIGAVIWLVYRGLALSPRLALGAPLMPIAGAAGAAAGIGYTVLTGAEVPTVRSCIAALLVLGGLALGREPLSLRLIAAAALAVLLLWPESLVGPSFQMSFAAVAVIVGLMETGWFRRLVRGEGGGRAERLAREGLGLFVTGLAVELALMPIAFAHFHQTGLLGALANLVAIPLTTFVIMPAEALALVLDMVGGGGPFWWVTGRALAVLLAVAHGVADQPLAVGVRPFVAPGTFLAMVLGGLWLLLWHTRVRWLGLAPLAGGLAALMLAPAPDVVVTGDGRHVGVRLADGSLALLRATLQRRRGRGAAAICAPCGCCAEGGRGRCWRRARPGRCRRRRCVRPAPGRISSSPTGACPAVAARAG